MKKIFIPIILILGLILNTSIIYSQDKTTTKLEIEQDSISGIEIDKVDGNAFKFHTISLTPRIVTKPLKYKRQAENLVLTFEYICPKGMDIVTIWFGPDFDNERKKFIRRVSPSKDWVVCSIDLSENIQDWGKPGDVLRIELGDDPNEEIQIRSIQLRPMNKEEERISDARKAKKKQDAVLEKNLRCYLNGNYGSSIEKVVVTAEKISIEGEVEKNENIFLCEVPPYMDVTEEQEFATVISITDFQFTVDQNRFVERDGTTYDRLLSKWVLAEKTKAAYRLVSNARYADEIESLYKLPKEIPATKKGLGGFYLGKGPVSDLDELGISSVTVNIRFATFMYSEPANDRIAYSYNGKDYYFGTKAVERLDATLLETAKRNIIVAAILLVNKAEQCPDPKIGKLLQHPDMDPAGNYSMPNMTTPESVDCYAAALDFLASRYSRPDKKYGRVHHWIIHNEVNMGTEWTNMGKRTELVFMDTYIKSMRMCYNIARNYNPHSEVMISVTKQWLWKSAPRFYLVKNLMDILLDYTRVEGDFQWGMANHPYPQSLFEPKTWLDTKAQFHFDTPIITFKNLEVLDAWIKLPEVLYKGKYKRTLWLSENGTNSRTYSEKDLEEQAAGLAYAWKKIEKLDGIDGIQWHNWIDSRREYGLRIGLRRFPDDETEPMGKKPVWYVYQAAGTNNEDEVLNPYKKTIGISEWDEVNYCGEIDQNNKKKSYRDIQSDTWVATDALGRELSTTEECSDPKDDRFVGMFYFLTKIHPGEEGFSNDVSKILKENPDNPKWGTGKHYWAEPEIGYYLSYDEWVIRRHAYQLSDAGVDVVIFDVTNDKTFPEVYLPICKVWRQMRKEGERTPYITFLGSEISINQLWTDFYKKGMYPDLWFYWKGKPLLLYGQHEVPVRNKVNDIEFSEDIKKFFNLRQSWAWTSLPWYDDGHDEWPWVDHFPQTIGWHESPDKAENVPVAVGQHPLSNIGRSFHQFHQPETDKYDLTPYTDQGLHFQEQWDYALKVDPEFIFVTGWNEWTASCKVMEENVTEELLKWKFYPGAHLGRAGKELKAGDRYFLDQYNQEYSRDIEPMKGGHTDNYYYQLISNVRKYKGARKGPDAGEMRTIDLSKGFDQWKDIKTVYYDHVGDVAERNSQGEGKSGVYKNSTGRNDIIESKVARDEDNIYVYVKTMEALTLYSDNNWMLLYIDADQNKSTGWEGYDYLINSEILSENKTTVKDWVKNKWKKLDEVSYTYSGNELMISIPKSLIEEEKVSFDFHWTDNIQELNDINEFFLNGDNAPERRFNYRYAE
ncbi:DUF5722 domain-containing protein [Sunxiuqinia sp. A32]|uniref:DUF5722 domain-containing protein n=1 Tax=Sunxiuqinia sp. A32 TaxID=3461496 RepID=UPI0040458B62